MRLGMGLGLGNLLSGQPITGLANKYSFNFDGSNDYLDCGSIGISGDATFTISFWAYWNGSSWLSNFPSVISNSTQITGQGLSTTFKDGRPALDFWSVRYRADNALDVQRWYHIAFTKTSGNISSTSKIYVNGSEVAGSLEQPDQAPNIIDSDIVIGRLNDSSERYWDGLIDEVALWDTALSASDVAKIASKPVDFSKASTYATDRTSNLKLWLRAGDASEPESTTAIARQDFYTDFDGTNDVVLIEDDSSFDFGTNDYTMVAWAKTSSSTNQAIVAQGQSGANPLKLIQIDSSGYFKGAVEDSSANSVVSSSDGGIWDDGNWHHFAIVFKYGDKMYRYVDGENVGTNDSISSVGSTDSSVKVGIGAFFGGTSYNVYPFNGAISNVSVYKTALDAQTISQMAKSRFTPVRDSRFSVVDFDGSNDYINTGTGLGTSLGDSYTGNLSFSIWANLTDVSATNDALIHIGDFSNNHGVITIVSLSNNIRFRLNGTTWSVTETLTSGWHHIMAVWDSSDYTKTKLYVDGVTTHADNSSSFPSSLNFDGMKTIIGAFYSSSFTYDGSISSVAIYNVAKSAEEVYAIYQQGITYDESSLSGLVGYWRMGDDTSKAFPTIADSSSNSNDGTITNGASDDIVQQMVAGYDLGAFESSSEELGGELSNKDFTGWTLDGSSNWSASSATSLSHTASSAGFASSPFSTSSGKLYKVSITINSGQTNTYKLQLGASSWLFDPTDGNDTWSGNHIFYVSNAGNSSNGFKIYAPSNFVGTFTDVSVKEVLQSEVSDTYPAIIDVNEPVLGAQLWDSDASTFDSGTHSWIVYGSNTVANDSGALKITYVNDARGAYLWLKDASDLSSDLTIGKTYKFTFDAKVSSGASVDVTISTLAGSPQVITETSFTTKSIYFTAENTTTTYVDTRNMGSGEIIYLDNLSLKEVQGNVGTMTNQDSADLVYSSVLPDQSFLATGVNSAYNFIDLDGSDEYISHSNISFTGAFSISSWINLDNVSSGRPIVGDTGNNNWFKIVDADTAGIRIAGGTATEWDAGMTFSTGSWTYIAVVRNSSNEIIVYVNGVAYTSNQPTLSGTYVINALGQKGNNQYFDGKIGQIALYNKALSETEVSAIYTLGRHGNLLDSYSDNLIGYWAMGALDAKTGLSDVGDGTIYDRSGNSNHGTATNTESADLKSSPNAEPNGYAKGDTNRSTTTP